MFTILLQYFANRVEYKLSIVSHNVGLRSSEFLKICNLFTYVFGVALKVLVIGAFDGFALLTFTALLSEVKCYSTQIWLIEMQKAL